MRGMSREDWLSGVVVALICSFALPAYAGGSAEPLRIEFKRGAASATVSERLKNAEEYDYVFGANAGQAVTIKIASKPKGKFTSFNVKGDGFDFSSSLDANYALTFTAPQTGDYLLTVRNQPSGKVKSASFVLTLAIK